MVQVIHLVQISLVMCNFVQEFQSLEMYIFERQVTPGKYLIDLQRGDVEDVLLDGVHDFEPILFAFPVSLIAVLRKHLFLNTTEESGERNRSHQIGINLERFGTGSGTLGVDEPFQ